MDSCSQAARTPAPLPLPSFPRCTVVRGVELSFHSPGGTHAALSLPDHQNHPGMGFRNGWWGGHNTEGRPLSETWGKGVLGLWLIVTLSVAWEISQLSRVMT